MRLLGRKFRSFIKLGRLNIDKAYRSIRQSGRNILIPLIVKKRSKSGILAIDIRNNHGLGSKLTWTLELLAYCEESNLQLSIRYSYPHIKKDYFKVFFQLKNSASRNDYLALKFTVIHSLKEVGFKESYDQKLTLNTAASLVKNNLQINSWICDAVEQYVNENFSGTVLGLHYRGTDKTGEAEFLQYERVYRNILLYSDKFGVPDKLFVSTDSIQFLNFILTANLPFEVLYRKDEVRSSTNVAVHYGINSEENAVKLNEEALLNCLILSKCSFLLKSSSFLSDWSKLFNPDLKVTVLNRPFDWALWFPGRALIEANAFTPLDN